MNTYLVYCDETGDDGATTESSEYFVLTSTYMNAEKWQENFNKIKECRRELKLRYGFHTTEEMHTKYFLTDKNPYRAYGWSKKEKREIINTLTQCIAKLDLKIINVIIDKTNFRDQNYPVLENALKYSIQRVENDSNGQWNYIIITDKGRIAPMRKTARAIRAFNPIQSRYNSYTYANKPIENLIEDILEKDSKESYFIQICDFVSYFVHLYYKCCVNAKPLPGRVRNIIDEHFAEEVMNSLKINNKLNLKASSSNEYGLVIYPK